LTRVSDKGFFIYVFSFCLLSGTVVSTMQDIPTYQAEHRALKALNGKLHAELWRLTRVSSATVGAIRMDIEANGRRMRTIEYLIHFLRQKEAGLE
jgi:hypothetical protein